MRKLNKNEIYRRADVLGSDGNVVIRIKLGKSNDGDWDRLNRILALFGEGYRLIDAVFREQEMVIDHISNLPWTIFEREMKPNL